MVRRHTAPSPRRPGSLTAARLVVSSVALCACKGSAPAPPCESPATVQVLMSARSPANVGDNGQSWPTQLVVYELSGTTSLERLDLMLLKQQGEQLFGDEFVGRRELSAYPDDPERHEMSLKPAVTHLLVAASFREPIGTAWYATFTVPKGVREAQCSATARAEPPPIPCVYLQIEGSELSGGNTMPPGFARDQFEVTCPVIQPPAPRKGRRKAPSGPPDLPAQPKEPAAPSGPKRPAAPKVPGK